MKTFEDYLLEEQFKGKVEKIRKALLEENAKTLDEITSSLKDDPARDDEREEAFQSILEVRDFIKNASYREFAGSDVEILIKEVGKHPATVETLKKKIENIVKGEEVKHLTGGAFNLHIPVQQSGFDIKKVMDQIKLQPLK